ncbi:hypothetical protein [Limosilactobacillus mucosae]|uniref:Uncharacterized protein n=1 Tax=Limosilactobacillus mucosae TaxID=97478 RepID=A0AAJ1HPZ0_LIMMU|nr:hypothetical protein [Limosilactobacillus mucosae]MDC2828457.1 hypothetical protein [Limosilactobacillus mucosae]MDC2834355.1 hypothetical protein [Limosilactobacillus mucosae]
MKSKRKRLMKTFNVLEASIEDAWLNNQENMTSSIRLAIQFVIATYGVGDLPQAITTKSFESNPIKWEILDELSNEISSKWYENKDGRNAENELIASKKEQVHNEEHEKRSDDNDSGITKDIQDENDHTSEKEQVHNEEHEKRSDDNDSGITKDIQDENDHTSEKEQVHNEEHEKRSNDNDSGITKDIQDKDHVNFFRV